MRAFRCDSCGEFHEGDPEMVLEEFDTEIDHNSNREVVSELCGECENEFRQQYTLQESGE